MSCDLPNGVAVTWGYDARNRLTAVEHRNGAANVVSSTYLWNAQGLRSRETTVYAPNGNTCRTDHAYDALGRLTATETGITPAGGNPCLAAGRWSYT